MRLGIDFGTTRTVVAASDRGNYPVVLFENEVGDYQPWYPSLIATRGSKVLYGLDAQDRKEDPEWAVHRSFKRLLGEVAPDTRLLSSESDRSGLEHLTLFLSTLREHLVSRSNLELSPDEPLEICAAVPANANSNQRFLTLEAFRRAGFQVLGMINEPSAAGIEYAHRYGARGGVGRKEALAVYDLGGGTFDVSLIGIREQSHEVLTNEGISRLGGDDFDLMLLELSLALGGNPSLTPSGRRRLLEECRQRKEGLHPNTRRFVVDLGVGAKGAKEVVILCETFYECCAPLIEQTIRLLESALERAVLEHGLDMSDLAAVYLVGGSADLPVVGRMLRHRFGKTVRRSPYPHAATAIGLAVSADDEAGYTLTERFSRYFGVWREADEGRRIVFDPIFTKDTPLPRPGEGPLEFRRSYESAHNVGHFRYLECSRLTNDGQPAGDITPWDEVYFPLDPDLRTRRRFRSEEIQRLGPDTAAQHIEELYTCDSSGTIRSTIANHTHGYRKSFRLRNPTA